MTVSGAASGLPDEGKAKLKRAGVSGSVRFPYISTGVLVLVVLVAALAPFIAPHNPEVGSFPTS